tara:strand:- start:3822 stop:5024 length:1203 start_codon:yes stop_codon:yes gene_type:complete
MSKKNSINTVGVLGAGLMGHGIAHSICSSGLDVIMIDTSKKNLNIALDNIKKILHLNLKSEKISENEYSKALERITLSIDYDLLKECDMIIEAVYENRELKQKIISNIESIVSQDCIFASNTSTIPITILAETFIRKDKFIGMHFFSPVDRMKLVELIMGKMTSQATLRTAMDFIKIIKKEPIVVNDGPGFFTTRVFQCFTNEGMIMLSEGIDPICIEKLAKEAGYPIGPLAILDEISIRLASHIRDQIRKYSAEKNKITDQPYDEVIDRMINKLGREGRKNGAGFYEYPINGKKYLWPGLKNYFPRSKSNFLKKDIKDRLYFSQAIETLKCFEEGIIQSYEDANKGSLLGWGFPSKTGGIINFIKSYGMNNFMEQSNKLAKKYGNRFNCPSIIKSMADS